jgi:uncharacterized protein YbcC (UPF0753/DUF2309 family)
MTSTALSSLSGNNADQHQAYMKAATTACQRIAPLWPLDQAIAVNPWWQLRQQSISDVSALVDVLGKVQCLMPKSYYKDQWQRQITTEHLALAKQSLGITASEQTLLAYLDEALAHRHWLNISDCLDEERNNPQKMAWHEEIIHQISQFCALFCQYPERIQAQGNADTRFYQAWLSLVQQDKGIEILMGEHGLNQHFFHLPADPQQLLTVASEELIGGNASPEIFGHYCHALLLDINGWASYLAYGAWQDTFVGSANNQVEQLLAVRLAWDLVVWRHIRSQDAGSFAAVERYFKGQLLQLPQRLAEHQETQRYLWVWQRALEYSYQLPLQQQLIRMPKKAEQSVSIQAPALQAVFCIDVRSEPMRRALEAQYTGIQTLGFAGFFGLPIEYSPVGSDYVRPQLPGLLKPAIRAEQRQNGLDSIKGLSLGIRQQACSQHTLDAAPSSFGLIEAQGLLKAFTLLKNSLLPSAPLHGINQVPNADQWILRQAGAEMTIEQLANLAAGVLQAMGLTQTFAPRVLLLGHGSCSANNPQAAALDCGACGGQTGEVNAKVLAQILNSAAVRAELQHKGITIPEGTRFIAGLHNTTTDEINCYDYTSEQEAEEPWLAWLTAATVTAQAQRIATLESTSTQLPAQAFAQRSKDWSQLRPEWGLANNAAFIVAPRIRTRHLDLQGRSFLHDYQWEQDSNFGILELIITAPMVVTNWINLQYYASVTDNLKYGSGNKLLHNVEGGHIGVFEGNVGDLRGGLALQSLHDGNHWRHQPLRLSVYIDAPQQAITTIINKHVDIAQLIDNQWLFLFQLASDGSIWQYYQGDWQSQGGRS